MAAKTRLTIEGPRPAPPEWLERFREIEPTAEMIDLGNGFWCVGSIRPHRERTRIGRMMRVKHLRLPDRFVRPSVLRRARAIEEGFAEIAKYTDAELHSGAAFRDFRERDWNFRTRADEAFLENLDARERGEAAKEESRRKEHQLMARELAPYLVRGRLPGVRVTANLN